jgi:ABC-2 type transport system ATP-binding protein
VDLVLGLKAEGRTVLLSSHILSDVERICDRVALIDSGRILLQGAVGELLGAGLTRRTELLLSRPVAPSEMAELRSLPFVESVDSADGGSTLRVLAADGDPDGSRRALFRSVADLSLPVISFAPVRTSLEELFLEKVARRG